MLNGNLVAGTDSPRCVKSSILPGLCPAVLQDDFIVLKGTLGGGNGGNVCKVFSIDMS